MMRASSAQVATAALILAVAGLLTTIYLLFQLRAAESALAPLRPFLADIVMEDGGIRTEIRIPAGTPIDLTIPIDERVQVHVDTAIPIDTRVVVPIRSALGSYDIPVPIRTSIPIRANVPVQLRQTFELRTRTPSELVIPIELGSR